MQIAIVEKNTDFTEGKGAMIFHKAFTTFKLAEQYIQTQGGIFGSKQQEKPSIYGKNENQTYYYNGYLIRMIDVLDSVYSKEKLIETRNEIKELQNQINLLEDIIK